MATKVKCKHNDLLQNSQYSRKIFFFRRSIWVLLELIRSRTQNLTIIYQEKHKIEQIYICNPMTNGFIHKHWFLSSVWNFRRWGTDVPPEATSPVVRSEEKWLFLQAFLGFNWFFWWVFWHLLMVTQSHEQVAAHLISPVWSLKSTPNMVCARTPPPNNRRRW